MLARQNGSLNFLSLYGACQLQTFVGGLRSFCDELASALWVRLGFPSLVAASPKLRTWISCVAGYNGGTMLRSIRLMLSAWLFTIRGRLRGRPRYPTWPFVFELLVRYLRLDWDETATWDDAKLRADLNTRPYPSKFAKRVKIVEDSLGLK